MSRKLDLSAFRGDGDDEEDDALSAFLPKKQIELNALKNRTFNHGITKKSKKDLEREAAERKQLEEEEALAKVNAELEAFESGRSTSFGSNGGGHAGGPGRMRGMGGGFVRAGGEGYAPPLPSGHGNAFDRPVPTGPAKMPPAGPSAMGYPNQHRQRSPSPPAPPKPKGKRAMDSFLAEIKSNQEQRENRLGHLAKQEGSSITALAAWEHNPAARKQADQVQESTNVMISNLPSNVTEESLGKFFAKCGPVGTVKIMYPRSAAELQAARTGRASLMGFVNFMKRESAAKAINELDKVTWGGAFLRLSWGQPMPIPHKAIYDLGESSNHHARESRRRSPSFSPPPRSSRRESPPRASASRKSSRSHSRSRSRSPSPSRHQSLPNSQAGKPDYKDAWIEKISDEQNTFVTAVAKRIKDHGKAFEKLLRDKEKNNAKFAFLFDDELPEYHLCKHIVDQKYRFPPPPYLPFNDDGYASCYSSDSAEDSEAERTTKGKIGRLARKRFEAMLRGMSGKRVEIARAMEFAVRHAEAADEVAEIVCKSLQVEQTAVPRKVARLHLVSDILHNSASPLPNVWRYRMAFETRLPAVFAHLAQVHQSLLTYSGKLSADIFRGQVGAVIEIWEGWIVFNQETSDQLRALFDGIITMTDVEAAKSAKAVQAQALTDADDCKRQQEAELGAGKGFKSGGFKKGGFKRIGNLDQEAEDLLNDALAGNGAEEEDLDGEAMDEDLDGEPMDEEDLDGEAMDIDGDVMSD